VRHQLDEAAEMDRDVLGLAERLALGVEQRRRAVAPLLMLVECEARISVSPVSSTIEFMAAPITSTATGSGSRRGLQDQVQIGIDPRGHAGRHQGGGIHLLDDRGTGEAMAGPQRVAA